MHILFICKIFRYCKSTARSKSTLNNGIVGHIQEHYNPLYGSRFLKAAAEIIRNVVLNPHGGKNNREVLPFRVRYFRLTHYLNRQLVMRKTGTGKNRQLLPSDKRHQTIYGAYTRVNVISRIRAGYGIQGLTVNIGVLFWKNRTQSVNWFSHSIKHSSQHLFRQRHFQRFSAEYRLCVSERKSSSALKHLQYDLIAVHLNHAPHAL